MKTNAPTAKTGETEIQLPVCGVVMPISILDGCPEAHWQDVKEILFESIEAAGFEPHLVSDADEVGIIQKRIIENLYRNPIVVCDVSGKNPNVMFELGVRLAFDKPTIIVKDEKTSYSFDTAPIEHLEYPRDLRFHKIVEFKEELAGKIVATHEHATKDTEYTTFLKHFGTFSVPKIDTKEVSQETFIIDQLLQLQKSVSDLSARVAQSNMTEKMPFPFPPPPPRRTTSRILCLNICDEKTAESVVAGLARIEGIGKIERRQVPNKHTHFILHEASSEAKSKALEFAMQIVPRAKFLPR